MSKFIICPINSRKIILSKLRKTEAFLDVHFFTKEEIFHSKYGGIKDEGLVYLIEKYNFRYFEAKEIAKILPYIDLNKKYKNERLNIYKQYLNELIFANYFSYDYTILELIKNQIVEIYDYYFDRKLNEVLDGNATTYLYVKKEVFTPKYYKFNSLNDELLFVFSKIGDLISHHVAPNKIHLLGVNDSNYLSIKSLAKNYHIKLNFNQEICLSDYPVSKKIIDYFYFEKNDPSFDNYLKFLEVSYPLEKDVISKIKNIIQRFSFHQLTNKEIAKIYQEIFALTKVDQPTFLFGLSINDSNLLNDDEYLFVLDFSSKNYPPKIKENSFLLDLEKAELNLLSTQEENLLKKEEFISRITQNKNIYLTFNRFIDGKEQYESFLINDLNVDKKEENILNIYSLNEAKNQLAIAKDNLYTYLKKNSYYDSLYNKLKEDSKYNTYDIKFRLKNKLKKYQSVELSYSSASNYVRCPFRYYLENVLKIDNCEDTFNLKIGTFVHEIFEKICEPFSFDKLFQNIENANNILDNEKCFIPRLKSDLEATYKKFQSYFERFAKEEFKHEYSFKFPLDDIVYLKGKVDLILSHENYLLFVDYKTSTSTYSINTSRLKYGDSMQLPTYSLLTIFDDKFIGEKIGGLAYLNLLSDKCNIATYDLDAYLKSLFFRGLFSLDKYFLDEFEELNKISNHKSEYFPKTYLSKRDKSFKDEKFFQEIQKITTEIYLSIGHRIYNNEFEISSLRFDGEEYGCSYCNFSDICFKDLSVYKDINLKFEDEDEIDD